MTLTFRSIYYKMSVDDYTRGQPGGLGNDKYDKKTVKMSVTSR